MMYQSLVVAILASTAVARPQHAHRHHHIRGSGGLATGTGAPYGTGNNTAPYVNSTSSAIPASTSTVADVVTVSVMPLPVSSGGSTVDPGIGASTSGSSCGSSRSTTTLTSTELVTITVDSADTSSTSAAAVSAVSDASTSSSSAVSEAAGAFYASSSSAGSTSYSTSYATASSASATSTAAAAYSASTSATSTSASATSSSTGSSSGSKRGLAYNELSLTDLFVGKFVSWAYNWASSSGGTVASGIEYVPMMWCPGKMSQDDWNSAAQSAIDSGSEHLLSFNEPDQDTQCAISASSAASSHITLMNPWASKASIGSPAVTNGGGTMGLTYLQNFFDACNGDCKVDFVNIHWYSGYDSSAAQNFKDQVSNATEIASNNGVSKVWVTEFALNGASDSDTVSFLSDVLPWLDQQSAVERYAFFMCADGLLTSGGSISSSIGSTYISESS